ncbi:MAG: exostosin domain-containing protein [Pontibacterium sp.]
MTLKISTSFPKDTSAPLLEALMPFANDVHLKTPHARRHYAMDNESCYQTWNQTAETLIEITEPDDADLILVPVNWYWVRRYNWRSQQNTALKAALQAHCDGLRQHSKPILVLFSGDRSCEPIALENVYVARESIYASRATEYDLILPAICSDMLAEHEAIAEPEAPAQTSKPSISFCGLARGLKITDPILSIAYYALQFKRFGYVDVSPYKGEYLRNKVIKTLSKSTRLDTHFIVRPTNMFIGQPDNAFRAKLRKEFINNMYGADYTLCIRGSGNFSFRFYEALSMGKVPVLIDTDNLLPFEDEIDWSKHIIRLTEDDLGSLDKVIANHRATYTQAQWQQLCAANRQLWLDYFTPEACLPRIFNSVIARHKKSNALTS